MEAVEEAAAAADLAAVDATETDEMAAAVAEETGLNKISSLSVKFFIYILYIDSCRY